MAASQNSRSCRLCDDIARMSARGEPHHLWRRQAHARVWHGNNQRVGKRESAGNVNHAQQEIACEQHGKLIG
jgi:hypothetical protein